jgi:GH25 family lysozyme M1 (1,4-beta-N-acetylmuramidase)
VDYRGIFLFDVSHWQGKIDFNKMKSYGASAVIMKASQGNWEDDRFAENWKASKGVLPRASYHYYDNRYPPKEQAHAWFEAIQHDLEGMCWLDLEDSQTGLYAGWRAWYDFIAELLAIYPGARIGIYSNFYYIVERLSYATTSQRNYFGQFPLWLASYQIDPFKPRYASILIPQPWLEYLILQSGTPAIGLDAGVESKEIDYNQFNGDPIKFLKFFGAAPAIPEIPTQPEEGTMKGTVLLGYSLNVRRTDNNLVIGALRVNDVVYGDVANNRISYNQIHRADGRVEALPVVCSSAVSNGATPTVWWMRLEAETPPVEPPADITVSVDADITATIGGVVYRGTALIDNVQLIAE